MTREPRVEIVDLGRWSGAALLAEYDAACDTIRINARALARVRTAGGAHAAERFIAAALAHERFHRAHPGADEAAVHAHVRELTGDDPVRYEKLVRCVQPAEDVANSGSEVARTFSQR